MDVLIWIDDITIDGLDKKEMNKKNSRLAKVLICEVGLFSG